MDSLTEALAKPRPATETAKPDLPPRLNFAPPAPPKRPAGTRRVAKVGAAVTLLGVALYAGLSEQGYVVSEAAVVTALTIPVRAPIEGYATGTALRVGDRVEANRPFSTIGNPWLDDQRLVDLRQAAARMTAERAAAATERAALLDLQATLAARAEEHRRAHAEFRTAELLAAERALAARVARRDTAVRDWQRRAALGREGVASGAELDRLRGDAEVAAREAEAAEARLASARAQADAAARGLLVDAGSNDIPYSAQRADELALRLAALDRQTETLSAAQAEAAARLAAEERRVAALREAPVASPVAGTVWRLGASPGERVAPGEVVAEVVDCAAAFLLVAVPQDRVPDVQLGAAARFRLAGEDADREGRVAAVIGEVGPGAARNLAAIPFIASRVPMYAVRVDLPPQETCAVGRTARVRLPSTGGFALPAFLRGLA
ncbi:MAG TPA: HlyD family efflux transporter periplasmic adaptor subunit [Acetobacteraceae bacterium]|nr:HlyD family efflux transporter periplasmic adaptor subunit [Acetobacteraceae bacterium]